MLVVNYQVGDSEIIYEAKRVTFIAVPANATPVAWHTASVLLPDNTTMEVDEGMMYVMSEGKTVAKRQLCKASQFDCAIAAQGGLTAPPQGVYST